MVDLQNATLSGGVAVGAIADLMIQPYGAFLAGTFTGVISCLGYRLLQPYLFRKVGLHDTCGVNNLHGMPGLISGLLSIAACYFATENIYGPSLYMIFPHSAPKEGSSQLTALQNEFPDLVEAGENRSMEYQALMQFAALAITLCLSTICGGLTGILLGIESVFDPLGEHEFFDGLSIFILKLCFDLL